MREWPYGELAVLDLARGIVRTALGDNGTSVPDIVLKVTDEYLKDPSQSWVGAALIYVLVAGGMPNVGTPEVRKRFGMCILRYSKFLDRAMKHNDPKAIEREARMVNLARYGGKYWGMKLPEVWSMLNPIAGDEAVNYINDSRCKVVEAG